MIKKYKNKKNRNKQLNIQFYWKENSNILSAIENPQL